MTKVVIFDFDGTISDIMELVSDIANDILPDYGRPQGLSQKDIQTLRTMTIPQALRYMKIPAYRLPKLAIVARQELTKRIEELKPIAGITEVLKTMSDNDVEMGIVTSNSRKNVMSFLRKNDLKHHFSFVEAGASIFGKSRNIRHAMKKQRIDREDCIYVGDEIRDIEACKAIKLDCISVTWGANARSILEKRNPSAVIDEPKQLLELILPN